MIEKELEGVTAPEIESPSDLTDDAVQVEESVAAEPASEEAPKGRTVENVRGELLRKQAESEAKILAELARLATSLTGKTQTANAQPQTFDDMTVEQLRAFRPNVPAERKQDFEDYFAERVLNERVEKKLNQHVEAEKYKTERQRANQLAVDRYPDLVNSASPLRAEVNRRLMALDQNYIKYNPRIVLNITEDVASTLGLTPRVVKGSRTVSQPSSTRGSKPAPNAETQGILSDEEYDKIARRLQHAKKGGFNKERVMARAAEYARFQGGKE